MDALWSLVTDEGMETVGDDSVGSKTEKKIRSDAQVSYAVVVSLGIAVVLGGVMGGLAIQCYPRVWIQSTPLRTGFLVFFPILTGGLSIALLEFFKLGGNTARRFVLGLLFGVAFALVRHAATPFIRP